MSLSEADAKFPGQGGGDIPPAATKENPGQVYPKSAPNEAPQSEHFDRPLPAQEGGQDEGGPPTGPTKSTGSVPGTGGPGGSASFAAKDMVEEAANPSVDQKGSGGLQTD